MAESKSLFIEDIKPDDQVIAEFLCQKKNCFTGKTGLPYLSISLMDKTGSVDAKIWDKVDQFNGLFQENDYVKVKATATTFNGRLQLRISNIRCLPIDEVNPSDYLPSSPFEIEPMLEELKGILGEIKNKNLKALIDSFLSDKEFMQAFIGTPAAKSIHHNYIGGLLEHTLSIMRMSKNVSNNYPQVDLDLLTTSAFLHDIGKVRELSYSGAPSYTDEGRLIGHISLGVEMLNEKITQVSDFPMDLKMLLTHILLSHHGNLEFGSPKRPKIVEAMVLSQLDDLDARINSFQAILDDETKENRWSSFQSIYGRYLYRWRDNENDAKENSEGSSPPKKKSKSNNNQRAGFKNSIKGGDSLNLSLFKDKG